MNQLIQWLASMQAQQQSQMSNQLDSGNTGGPFRNNTHGGIEAINETSSMDVPTAPPNKKARTEPPQYSTDVTGLSSQQEGSSSTVAALVSAPAAARSFMESGGVPDKAPRSQSGKIIPTQRRDGRKYVKKYALNEDELIQQRDEIRARLKGKTPREMTKEEFLEEQRAANRLSAFQSRKRRQNMIDELQSTVTELTETHQRNQEEIARLEEELEQLKEENADLCQKAGAQNANSLEESSTSVLTKKDTPDKLAASSGISRLSQDVSADTRSSTALPVPRPPPAMPPTPQEQVSPFPGFDLAQSDFLRSVIQLVETAASQGNPPSVSHVAHTGALPPPRARHSAPVPRAASNTSGPTANVLLQMMQALQQSQDTHGAQHGTKKK